MCHVLLHCFTSHTQDAEAKAKLATISKNLKGRDYAYDHQVGM
jgi:hypothetical protein